MDEPASSNKKNPYLKIAAIAFVIILFVGWLIIVVISGMQYANNPCKTPLCILG
jgi:hypothetical protein